MSPYDARVSDASHYAIDTRHELTPRQKEVLKLVADGLTNAEIGERLGITLEGAKHHVSEILSKLGVSSREEAAEWWRANEARTPRRFVRALWPWPALGATVLAAAAAGVGILAAAGDGQNDEQPAAQEPLPVNCQAPTLSYELIEFADDGAVYFSVTGEAQSAPCKAAGDINLVPVRARADEPANVDLGIRRNFNPQVEGTIEPAGSTMLVLKWSNWCASAEPIVWRPMATGFATPPPFVDEAAPRCADAAEPSTLERIDGPAPETHGVRFANALCVPGDVTFQLYEESGWRPGEPALLEVRPAAPSCAVYRDALVATLFVDNVRIGEARISIDAPLYHAGYRMPFRWSGPCTAGQARLEVALSGSTATLYPAARPYCGGTTSAHDFRAGW